MTKLYRSNVVAIVQRPDGRVLVGLCRRRDFDEWQLPQGGVDDGESLETALHRELLEETGLKDAHVTARTQNEIKYDWPEPKKKNGKVYAGQTQTYFVVQLSGIDRPQPSDEFIEFDWITPLELMARAMPMRRPVYELALRELNLI